MNRRETVKVLAAGVGFWLTPLEVRRAAEFAATARSAGRGYEPTFFTPHEWETARVLVDLVIPRDGRSGSATDAGVPEFMDFVLSDEPSHLALPGWLPSPLKVLAYRLLLGYRMGRDVRFSFGGRTAMRGGLAWLDHECDDRYGKTFVASADAERVALLDDIAWPKKAKPADAPGVAFFNAFRDLTASGFWSSKMGVQDLRYLGNVVVPEWKGCPDEQLKKLGVKYP